MKPGDVRVCPSCQARNKAKWEFCVRCGESLQDVPIESQQRATASTATAVAAPQPQGGIGAGAWLLALGGVVVVGLAAVVGARFTTAPEPGESTFAVPTLAANTTPNSKPVSLAPGEGHLAIAQGLIYQSRYAEAIKELDLALAEAPNDAKVHHAYGTCLWFMGSRDESLRYHRQAARLDPREVDYRLSLARTLGSMGQPKEAMEEYQAALDIEPRSSAAMHELGGFYFREGNYKAAAPLLARAAELSRSTAVLEELGGALANAGDAAGAMDAYRKALEMNPKSVSARGLLAELLIRNGKGDDAIALTRAGIQENPEAAQLHRDLASFLERAGRITEAAAEYREYARLAPNAPDSKTLIERAAALEQKASSAS